MRFATVFLLLLFPVLANGQVVTTADWYRNLPICMVNHSDSTMPANSRASGTGQTWNFTGLNPGLIDTNWGQTIISEPYPFIDSFPGTNLVTRSIGPKPAWAYYYVHGDTNYTKGVVSINDTDTVFTYLGRPGFLTIFPMQLGSHYTFPDTLTIVSGSTSYVVPMTVTVDGRATGTVTTPVETRSVLLVGWQFEGTVRIGGIPTPMHRYQGTLFDPSIGAVAEWDSMRIDVFLFPQMFKHRVWHQVFTPSEVEEGDQSSPNVFFCPNPANGWVKISLPDEPGVWVLRDAIGREVLSLPSRKDMTISVNGLAEGVYPFQWNGAKSMKTGKITIVR